MKKLLSLLSVLVTTSSGVSILNTNLLSNFSEKKLQKNLNAIKNYTTWNQANPARSKTIINKVAKSKVTKFQPYLDGGLTSNNDVGDVQKFAPSFNNITLAFVQQAIDVKDHLDLTVAGIPKSHVDYTDQLLAQSVYNPLAAAQKINNMVLSFGGANASKTTNPWSVALQITQGDKAKAQAMLEDAILNYAKHISDLAGVKSSYPKNLDFDIEGGSLISDLADTKFLFETLAHMKTQGADLKIFDSSLTLPVLPTGLTNDGLKVLNSLVEIWHNAGLDLATLPIINLMTMDYGESFYDPNKTNFDLLQEAVDNTKLQLKTAISNSYSEVAEDSYLYSKLGATPMIGINDVEAFVFTLEDAKELYNWANEKNLGVIRMWSFNDDAPFDIYGSPNKTLFSHGINYLNPYDFAKAFSGDWDNLVQNPYTSPNQPLVPPVPVSIQSKIKQTYLSYVDSTDADELLTLINSLNNTTFTYKDIKISEITASGARLSGRGSYTGNVYISYQIKDNLNLWVNNAKNQLDLGVISKNDITTIQENIFKVAKTIEPSLAWIDWTKLNMKKIGINEYVLTPVTTDNTNPFLGSTIVVYELYN